MRERLYEVLEKVIADRFGDAFKDESQEQQDAQSQQGTENRNDSKPQLTSSDSKTSATNMNNDVVDFKQKDQAVDDILEKMTTLVCLLVCLSSLYFIVISSMKIFYIILSTQQKGIRSMAITNHAK